MALTMSMRSNNILLVLVLVLVLVSDSPESLCIPHQLICTIKKPVPLSQLPPLLKEEANLGVINLDALQTGDLFLFFLDLPLQVTKFALLPLNRHRATMIVVRLHTLRVVHVHLNGTSLVTGLVILAKLLPLLLEDLEGIASLVGKDQFEVLKMIAVEDINPSDHDRLARQRHLPGSGLLSFLISPYPSRRTSEAGFWFLL